MNQFDLTGQHISTIYPRIIQTVNSLYYDGIGNTVSIGVGAIGPQGATGVSGIGGIGGTGTINYIPKFTGLTALGNSLIYDSGTYVGIGTTAPANLLDVVKNQAGSTRINIENTDASGISTLRFTKSGGAAAALYENVSNQFTFQNATNGGTLRLQTTTSGGTTNTALTIDANQNIGIGTITPNASAILDLTSTIKGFLPPRMTTVQRNTIGTPVQGLIVYDIDLLSLFQHNGATWVAVGTAGTNGNQGFQGFQGPIGITGTNGTNGNQGFQGFQGPIGITGTNGTNGNQGFQGFQGPIGITGTNGTNGNQGPQGIQGAQGNQGFQGFQGPISADISQITITTSASITTDTTSSGGISQKGKNVIIDNGANPINITVNGGTDFCVSYVKHGSGAITFVQGSGRTMVQVDSTAILNGAVGSTAVISSIGTTDYLRISNA